VIGVSTAYSLARAGWHVSIYDRESGPGLGASHANGAQLSYAYADALGSPQTLAALPRILGGSGGVSMRLSLSPAYICWLARFARNCTRERFRKNTQAVLELAASSRRAMDELCDRHSLDFARRAAGKVQLLHSEQERALAELAQSLKRSVGIEQDVLSRADLSAVDPALGDIDQSVIGAVSTPSEEIGDPYLFCRSLLPVLNREYGVTAVFGAAVKSLKRRDGKAQIQLGDGEHRQADLAVVCQGTDCNQLLGPLGHSIALQPMKGYSFEMPLAEGSPQISVTDAKRRLVLTNLGDRIRVAGFAELGNTSHDISKVRIEKLRDEAKACMPSAGDYSQINNLWSGLRPVTPNSQPVIAQPAQEIAINTGHGSLGWTLAMGSAERLARLVS